MKTTSVTRRCRECGIGTVHPVGAEGRVATYKKMRLEIPAQVQIPTCDNCGAEWMDRATAEALDAALEELYREELRALFVETVEPVAQIVSMRRLEAAMGLSEGYLSKVKQGRSDPSASLVSSLALIARDPEGGLNALEGLWKHRALMPPAPAPRTPPLGVSRASQVRDISKMPSVADTFPHPRPLSVSVHPSPSSVPARKPKKNKGAPTGSRRGHGAT